jgi:raffinose/stachyose/melibiose transport system substrate-binding protein
MKQKIAVLFFCMACIVLSFSSCEKKAVASDGKVHLTLWHSYVGADQRAEFMTKRLEQFQAANPNVVMEVQGIPRDQYQTRLKTQAAAGALPDAFNAWPNTPIREYVEAGLLANINDVLAQNPEWRDSIIPIAVDQFSVDGNAYGVGLGISVTSLFFYNKALFEKYGVKVPETYAELKTAIETFKKNNIIPIALGNKARWPAQSEVFSIVANRVTGSPWFLDAAAGKNEAKFTDQTFIDALGVMKELADLNAFNRDYNTIDDVQVRQYFYTQEAAMMINGTWVIPDMVQNAPANMRDNIEIGAFPAIAGGKGTPNTFSGVSSTSIVISAKTSPEQRAVLEKLIMFLTDDEAQKMYMDYYIPVSSTTAEVDIAATDPIYAKLVTVMKEHPNMVDVYDSVLSSEQTEIINNGLQSIMLAEQTPQQIAESLARTVR